MQEFLSFSRENPFNDLPILPPNIKIETEQVLKRCLDASYELNRLNVLACQIEDQRFLTRIIPYIEATYSSEIENIVTTTDKIFSPSSIEDDPSTKEARRYGFVLNKYAVAAQYKRPLSIQLIEDIGTQILGKENKIRSASGTQLREAITRKIIYTPPEGSDLLKSLLSNMLDFLNADTRYNALIKAAILHYQFVAIHPFADGNGRTSRILTILYLLQKDVLSTPILYLSRYIIENKREYYGLIRNVTESGEWEDWICFILRAIEESAKKAYELISKILKLRNDSILSATKSFPKFYTEALVNLCFEKPYCSVDDVLKKNIVASRQTAIFALRKLSKLDLIDELSGSRKIVFRNSKLLDELAKI